ncbi:hypothetical protein J6590_105776, partial [Homalodisca vitripennis]
QFSKGGGAVEKDFEAAGIKVDINNKKQSLSIFTNLTNLELNYVLMGDFNVDALNNTHPTTIRPVDMLRSFGLELLLKSTTRVTPTSQTAIDNVVSNIPKVAVSVVNTAISDHYGQEAIIMGKQIERGPKITKIIRDTRPNNIAHLIIALIIISTYAVLKKNYILP